MKKTGQIILFSFPQTNLSSGKTRPALLLGKMPGMYNDWLICMISSQIHQYIQNFDELVDENAPDFIQSGLRMPSVIRVGRLAVVEETILLGAIGEIADERLKRIKTNIADWLSKT